jgi:hypothetical protein
MSLSGALLVLGFFALIVSIFVWLWAKVQERSRAHYRAMITIASSHGLKFVDDPEPTVRLHLKGTIDGIGVTLLSKSMSHGRARSRTTQVTAARPNNLPKGGRIIRPGMARRLQTEGEETLGLSQRLRDGRVRRAFEDLTEPLWAKTSGTGRLDDHGIHLIKNGFIGDEAILAEMLKRAVAAATAIAAV